MNRGLVVALGIVLGASSARSQDTRLTFDMTSARMQYADSLTATAVSVSPRIRVTAAGAAIDAYGTLSQLGRGTTASGQLDASLFPLRRARYAAEVELFGGGSTHSDGGRTGEFLASARLHLLGASRGLWLAGGSGRTWDGAWRDVLRADAGVWLTSGPRTLSLSVMPTAVDDSITYADAVASLTYDLGTLDIEATVGARTGDQLPSLASNRRVWGGAGVSYHVVPTLALVGSLGTYPVDLAQGYPGGRYVSAGLRFAPGRRQRSGRGARERTSRPADAIQEFRVGRASNGWTLRVLAPVAQTVEIAGDFTSWDAVRLGPMTDGWWSVTLPIEPGTHQMNVRVNGGPWLVPPGLTPLADEFGIVSGLLAIAT